MQILAFLHKCATIKSMAIPENAVPAENSESERETIRTNESILFPPHFDTVNSLTHPESIWLRVSRLAVGEGYLRYYHKYLAKLLELGITGEEMDTETYGTLRDEVATKLCDDPYSEIGRAYTATQLTHNGNGHKMDISSTARVVLGKKFPDASLAPLESMELAEPDIQGGWGKFLERRSLDRTCELSRVVVPKEYTDQGLTPLIVKDLIDGENGVKNIAETLGMKHMVMIAQRKFAKYVEGTSIKFSEPIPIRLNPAGEEVARTFPGYWKDPQDPPALYIARILPRRRAQL